MRRKQAHTPNPLSPNTSSLASDSDAPKSPASTGAMDDLLQKLRAAKPEARDQRDRRRRARLKDKHQVRVASGQKIPELDVNMEEGDAVGAVGSDAAGQNGLGRSALATTSEAAETDTQAATAAASGVLSPTATGAASDADIADRAAAMLEGLQSSSTGGAGGGLNKDGSLSVRRRRESADTERQRRRNRRNQTGSSREDGGGAGGLVSPTTTILEEGETGSGAEREDDGGGHAGQGGLETPTTVVVPPSPEIKGRELPTPPPEERL